MDDHEHNHGNIVNKDQEKNQVVINCIDDEIDTIKVLHLHEVVDKKMVNFSEDSVIYKDH